MQPLFADTDRVLFDPRAYKRTRPRVGDIVVARLPAPDTRLMVKYVARVDASSSTDESLCLRGTNALASTDSRHFGDVPLDAIVGKVTAQL